MSFRLGFLAALLLICIGSLMPDTGWARPLADYDKALHFSGYFGLAILGALGWPRLRGVFLLGLPLLGLGLEVAQGYAPGREFDWADALTNGAGIGLAVALSAALTGWLGR